MAGARLRPASATLGVRWLTLAEPSGRVPEHDPSLGACFDWKGRKNSRGYAVIPTGDGDRLLHRELYEQFHGPIPDGYEVDHLCHHWEYCKLGDECPHRSCANPLHWLAVPPYENNLRSGSVTAANARKTHCIRGHPLEGANLRVRADRPGHRECKTCAKVRRCLARLVDVVTAGGQGLQLGLFDELGGWPGVDGQDAEPAAPPVWLGERLGFGLDSHMVDDGVPWERLLEPEVEHRLDGGVEDAA